MTKVEVTKLTIDVNGREYKLSLDEAQAMRKALNEMFGAATEHHHHHTREVIKYQDYWRPWYYETTLTDNDLLGPTWSVGDSSVRLLATS